VELLQPLAAAGNRGGHICAADDRRSARTGAHREVWERRGDERSRTRTRQQVTLREQPLERGHDSESRDRQVPGEISRRRETRASPEPSAEDLTPQLEVQLLVQRDGAERLELDDRQQWWTGQFS
jgi:hypothetical protein